MTRIWILPICISLTLTVNSVWAANDGNRNFGAGSHFTLDQLPPGQFKSRFDSLPPKARQRAENWLNNFSFPEADVEYMRIDDEGGVYYEDSHDHTTSTTSVSQNTEPSGISVVEAFSLHSKPGANAVLIVDVDGHVVSGTAWNNGRADPLYAKAFDTDGNSVSYSPSELDNIAEIWHRIAEDFAMFDVDVTTEDPGVVGPKIGRILITENYDENGNAMPSPTAGGVAYVSPFGGENYPYYSPAFVYFNQFSGFPPYIAEAAAHEAGHNLGLSHDGTADGDNSVGYYSGHGSGAISWGPIMGTGYNDNVSQWSNGQYAKANNLQDDISIIASKLSVRNDDHADSFAAATLLLLDANGTVTSSTPESDPFNVSPANKGIINSQQDVDYFAFTATAQGDVNLTITPSWAAWLRSSWGRGTNLDIEVTLYDVDGNVLLRADPTDETNATITTTLSAGDYYLAITGVGNTASPYPDYGSQGQYFISGFVPVGSPEPPPVEDTAAPSPNPMSFVTAPFANDSSSISMSATPATDDSGSIVEYFFSSDVFGNSGWLTSPDFTAAGLTPATTYSWQVKARDAAGNETAMSALASATTEGTPTDPEPPVEDTTAPTPNPMRFASNPESNGTNSVTMTAVIATDESDDSVQYFFTSATAGNSGWLNSPNYTATNLDAATTYTWQVKARDAVGNETTLSAHASATTDSNPIDPQPPAAVSDLVIADDGNASAILTWSDVADETGYQVYRETWHQKRAIWRSTTLVAFPDADSTTSTDAASAGLHRYYIRSLNEVGYSDSNWVEVSIIKVGGGSGCKGGAKKCGST